MSNLKVPHIRAYIFFIERRVRHDSLRDVRRLRGGLSFHMEEGQQVVVLGSVSVYEAGWKVSAVRKEIIPDGAGLLYERFEALKKELEEMGMFAAEYKQPVPRYARTIGVVTAPTGAAIRDIINVAKRRNPFVRSCFILHWYRVMVP